MEVNETVKLALTVLGALGGVESVKYFLNWKANHKKAAAEATTAQNNVLDNYAEEWRKIAEEHRAEKLSVNARLDGVYVQLDEYRMREIEHLNEITRLKLHNKELEYDRCTVSDCLTRKPPRSVSKGVTQ